MPDPKQTHRPRAFACGLSLPYAVPVSGAALVLPGSKMGDAATLATLINEERVTCAAGVPTVWMNLLALSAHDQHGWFDTGDVATIDQHGYLQITDRAKDIIKSGGEWISSIDLENAALLHPLVQEAAVIGVPHPKWDERPSLYVVGKNGARIDEESLRHCLACHVADWWLPDTIIQTDALPHTATGKLDKRALREKHTAVTK